MDIFIRRLPEATTRHDIIKFVSDALMPRWKLFGSKPIGTLNKCSILQITDPHPGNIEFHGLLKIEPATAALEVIKRINGTYLKSKKVEVRKYYRRSAARDRRRKELQPLPGEILEQRKRDRRRPSLKTEMLTAGITSPDMEKTAAV